MDEEELGHEEINKRILRKLEKIKNRIDSSMQKYEESRKNMNNQKKNEEVEDFERSLNFSKELLSYFTESNFFIKVLNDYLEELQKLDLEKEIYQSTGNQIKILKNKVKEKIVECENNKKSYEYGLLGMNVTMMEKINKKYEKHENEIQEHDQSILRTMSIFFSIFTLIASNASIIFKASERLNVYDFLSIILVVNSVVVLAIYTLFTVIDKNNEMTKNKKNCISLAIVGIILGVIIKMISPDKSSISDIEKAKLIEEITIKVENDILMKRSSEEKKIQINVSECNRTTECVIDKTERNNK